MYERYSAKDSKQNNEIKPYTKVDTSEVSFVICMCVLDIIYSGEGDRSSMKAIFK